MDCAASCDVRDKNDPPTFREYDPEVGGGILFLLLHLNIWRLVEIYCEAFLDVIVNTMYYNYECIEEEEKLETDDDDDDDDYSDDDDESDDEYEVGVFCC